MSRYYDKVGFIDNHETAPGVWTDPSPVERFYSGDVLSNSKNIQPGDDVNDNVKITNQISILADMYALNNANKIRYAYYLGTPYKITHFTIQSPRIVLTFGGEYNG